MAGGALRDAGRSAGDRQAWAFWQNEARSKNAMISKGAAPARNRWRTAAGPPTPTPPHKGEGRAVAVRPSPLERIVHRHPVSVRQPVGLVRHADHGHQLAEHRL